MWSYFLLSSTSFDFDSVSSMSKRPWGVFAFFKGSLSLVTPPDPYPAVLRPAAEENDIFQQISAN